MRIVSNFSRLVLAFQNHFSSAVAMNILAPPKHPGLTELERDKFKKLVSVPTITIPKNEQNLSALIKLLKKFFLKLEKFHPVSDGKFYLNPEAIKDWKDLPTDDLLQLEVASPAFAFEEIELSYENWKADELVKSITPDGLETASSFSKIGHIIHLNLKDELLPYKKAIAQIYLDKVPGVRTIINKAQSIDNTFRNFQIELLLGEENYQVETKENGSIFEFDFSTVYWNPRLSGEHERLVKLLNPNDFLYDVFAGVGPFSVPAGKKRVNVLSNDLNPNSFKWLQHNVKRNKVAKFVETSNKDGREFILQDVKRDLLERIWKRDEDPKEYAIHIAMNLPGLAVTFLDAFVGLLKGNERGFESSQAIPIPICHCYCFVKGIEDPKVMAQALVEEHIGFKLKLGETLQSISFVRNVAPNKDMMRVDILLTSEILFDVPSPKRVADSLSDPVNVKKQCIRDGEEIVKET